MYKISDLYNLKYTLSKKYLENYNYPWQVIGDISNIILELGKKLPKDYFQLKEDVWIHKTAIIAPTAVISGPCIIGKNTEVRHCAFIRSSALIGNNCVIGNSVELKNVILFDNVQVPHFNYVGDSILGYKSHMGAGAITSNVKSDKTNIIIKDKLNNEQIPTNLKKIGAILGDYVEIGCNSVLNPGTIIGKNTTVYPLSSIRGVIPSNSIYKSECDIVKKY